jgi:hypothetical protein
VASNVITFHTKFHENRLNAEGFWRKLYRRTAWSYERLTFCSLKERDNDANKRSQDASWPIPVRLPLLPWNRHDCSCALVFVVRVHKPAERLLNLSHCPSTRQFFSTHEAVQLLKFAGALWSWLKSVWNNCSPHDGLHVCLLVSRAFLAKNILIQRSRDSVVGVATGYELDNRGVGVWVPIG